MHSQHQTYLREYTYVPHGSGIVYITIAVDGSWGGIDLLREGPRCTRTLRLRVSTKRSEVLGKGDLGEQGWAKATKGRQG